MKLLFITQKVDLNDDVLGVYHRWIEELAKRIEKISVICLYRGQVELPSNVAVYSLGKEQYVQHQSTNDARMLRITNLLRLHIIRRFVFLSRFYKYIWKLRKDYDRVFVHMNPEYVVLGRWFWKIFEKKTFFWYNHPLGSFLTKAAIVLANRVFYTSPLAFASQFAKSAIMPAGIDTVSFSSPASMQKVQNSLLCLGRIASIKNIEYLIMAAKILNQESKEYNLHIIGSPIKSEDFEYAERLKKMAASLAGIGKIKFSPSVSHHQTPQIYNQNEIFINLTSSGSFDKTILEAMSSGILVLVSNKSFIGILPPECIFEEKDSHDLASKLGFLLSLPPNIKVSYGRGFRNYVVANHDLALLVKRLVQTML